MEEISFANRVANELKRLAPLYKSSLVDNEYLIYSSKLTNAPYYVISSSVDNFMHLTGLKICKPTEFFSRCLFGLINESDLSFTSKSLKGSVRRKIKSFPMLLSLFNGKCLIQESLNKNKIVCSFASSNSKITIGFCMPNEFHKVKPMTLLVGNELDSKKCFESEIILKKGKDDKLFNILIQGTKKAIITAHLEALVDIDHLLNY